MSGALLAAAGAQASAGITSMTLSSNWNSPSGASPQTTLTRTLTVPAGNPGNIAFRVSTDGVTTYSTNGGAFSALADNDVIAFANSDTIALRLAGTTKTATITATDNATGAVVGTTTITTT